MAGQNEIDGLVINKNSWKMTHAYAHTHACVRTHTHQHTHIYTRMSLESLHLAFSAEE